MSFALFVLLSGAAPGALMAQEVERRPPVEMEEGDEIVVTGQPERGAVPGDVRPEQQFRAADIRALGVASISEMVSELSAETNGTPIILLNGKRISSFSEIQDLPAEAVARVDVLPEQVASSYGYAPTQKVMNIVLRPRFRAESADLRGGTTTDGGRESGSGEVGVMRIRGDNRFTLNLKYSRAAHLLESQRDIDPTAPSRPYSLGGNVAAMTQDGEIDPALSALAGEAVTVAAVPESAGASIPSLDDFVAGANRAGVSDLGRYRTLSPATESFSANATLARALGGVSATVNGRLELSDNDSLQGLSALALDLPAGHPFSPFANDVRLYRYLAQAGALGQNIRGTTGHVGITLNGGLGGGWQWSFTGNGDISDTRTRTDRGVSAGAMQALLDAGDPGFHPYGPIADDLLATRLTDRARAKSQAISGDLLLSGPLFDLPAGEVTTSVRLGGSANGFESWSIRSGVERNADYNREIASGQVSLDVPLTSRSKGVLGALGDIGVNMNAAAQRLSDFGTLSTLGYGLRWKPVRAVQILMSANQDRAAPTGSQITDPLISTPNMPVFDYATGQTVFVTQLSGGNAALKESVRDQFRLSATVKPFDKPNLTLTATYLNSRTRNPIAAFPTPTPAIEAAFQDRFLRDADGNLMQIDARPINFLRSQSEQLRWGFNLSIPIKSRVQKLVEAWRAAGARPEDRPAELRSLFGNRRPGGAGGGDGEGGGPPRRDEGPGGPEGPGDANAGPGGGRPGGGFGGPGGFGGRRGGGGGGGRLSFGLYHTWHLTESILIAPGVPELNLLSGDATGSSGGQPRHEVQARLGYSNNGIGGRLSVDWESGTHVDGALGGASRLNFGSLATANLRLFANLGQMPGLARDHPFLRGARVSIGIDNIFNARRHVTDATGATPLRYQRDYLDPLGRTVSISFRKLFF
ncbi:TonB-dependent receptor [Sphingobium cloacae]|uniref:TonB-dependent receptor-like protein n=2 Tax=Sphingobium cloacae TaxID=120107 RepID=A0A1E1F5F1_9SPHN|nr:TonB-dependent receptor [Sphingobium cloacae]BAV65738.1 TonB-dependent receptor-like protein [Sphingobium cloacae]